MGAEVVQTFLKQYLTTADDDKNDQVKHYGPQASTAVVFKIENERTGGAVPQARKPDRQGISDRIGLPGAGLIPCRITPAAGATAPG